jgi:hypothetical protein
MNMLLSCLMSTQNEPQHLNVLVVLSPSNTIQAQLTVILETILMKVPSKTTYIMLSEGSLHSDKLVPIPLDGSRINSNEMNSPYKENSREKVKGGDNGRRRFNSESHLKLLQGQNK